MYQLNYVEQLTKIDNVLEAWTHRNLTLLGKIVIVNNLVSTQLVNKFLALPSPKPEFYSMYREKISRFLWGAAPAKITYSKLVQDSNRLGLKLVDIRTKDLALKAAWPVRFNGRPAEEVSWFYNTYLIQDKRIWECNLDSKDIQTLVKENELSSCTSILSAWCSHNYAPVLEEFDEILNVNLWGNSDIRRMNKPIFNKTLVESQVDKLMCIVHPTGKRFLTYQELTQEFGPVITELWYLSIKAAIPRIWKHKIKNENWEKEIDIDRAVDRLAATGSASRVIYWSLVKKIFPPSLTSKLKWEMELKTTVDDDEWWSFYLSFCVQIKPTKLRHLQYRVLTGTLTTNVKRHTWNSSISPFVLFVIKSKKPPITCFGDAPKYRNYGSHYKR